MSLKKRDPEEDLSTDHEEEISTMRGVFSQYSEKLFNTQLQLEFETWNPLQFERIVPDVRITENYVTNLSEKDAQITMKIRETLKLLSILIFKSHCPISQITNGF